MYQRYDSNPRPITRVGAMPAQSLLAQVLGLTAVGFLITAAGAYLSWGIPVGLANLAFFVGFFLIFGIHASRENPGRALAFFYAFTACEGVGLAPMLSRYISTFGPDIVVNAAATTGFGMAILAAVVYTTSFDFRRLQGIAFIGLMVLIVAGLVSMFVHFLHPETYAWGTLVVFTLWTLIDFARIRAGGDAATPVELAVEIYLDALNLFIALLQIFGLRSRED